jgi:hypothetical protein
MLAHPLAPTCLVSAVIVVPVTVSIALTLSLPPSVSIVAIIPSIVVTSINLPTVLPNLFPLVANFVVVLARFAPVALANLAATLISQSLQVPLVPSQSFTLSMITWRVIISE